MDHEKNHKLIDSLIEQGKTGEAATMIMNDPTACLMVAFGALSDHGDKNMALIMAGRACELLSEELFPQTPVKFDD